MRSRVFVKSATRWSDCASSSSNTTCSTRRRLNKSKKEQRRLVDEAVTQAKASPLPPVENLTKNMNLNVDNVVVRGVDSQTFHPVV